MAYATIENTDEENIDENTDEEDKDDFYYSLQMTVDDVPQHHTYRLTSPYRRTQSKIDHVLVNSKWRGSLQDVRTIRNVDDGTDHNLLVAKMTLKLRNAKIGMARNQRPDISKLKDTLIKE